jgi:hypothetical protein
VTAIDSATSSQLADERRSGPGWLGFLLLAIGIAIIAVATPTDNVVVQTMGSQQLTAPDVAAGGSFNTTLSGEARAVARAPFLDVQLTFQVQLDHRTSPASTSPLVVSTFGGDRGLLFTMISSGQTSQLISVVGGDGQILQPVQRVLVNNFPLHQWVSVSAIVTRGQSYRYTIDGQQVQAFTYNSRILNPAPTKLSVSGAFAGSVRNVTMDLTGFRVNPNRLQNGLVRGAQILGMLLMVAGTIVLAERFLRKLIQPAMTVRSPLVKATFWTLGVGIVANVVVDALHLQHSSNPYFERNSWLLTPYVRFSDFFQVHEILRSFNPYGIQSGSYPPIGYWIVAPVIWMKEYPALFVTLSMTAGFLVWWFSRVFTVGLPAVQRGLFIAFGLISLPVTFAADRGNVDLIVFVMMVVGISAVEQRRNTLAATWIGLAAAAKIFPVIYLFVFLRGRRLRFLIYGVLVIGIASLIGFIGFHLTLKQNVDGLRLALSTLQMQMKGGLGGTYFNASIPGWLQGVGYAVNGTVGDVAVRNAIEPFVTVVELATVVALAAYLRWREQSLWRGVTLMTLVFLLFTDVSNYYELIFLFIPLALFVKSAGVNRRTMAIAILFGAVLAPRAYFYLQDNFVDSSVFTTAPLLVALGIVVIVDGRKERAHSAIKITNAGVEPQLLESTARS